MVKLVSKTSTILLFLLQDVLFFCPSQVYLLKCCCCFSLRVWEPTCSSLLAGAACLIFLWVQALTHLRLFLFVARATLEILIPDFVKQTSEEKPKDSEELEVSVVTLFCWERTCHTVTDPHCLHWDCAPCQGCSL